MLKLFFYCNPSEIDIFEISGTCLHGKTDDFFLIKMFCLCFIEYFHEKYHLLSIFCTAKYQVNSIITRVKAVPMQCQNHPCLSPGDIQASLQRMSAGGGKGGASILSPGSFLPLFPSPIGGFALIAHTANFRP